ncbi:hypothetical protein Phum_PHUM304330 [Pediculus humanus corporis]|uniref:Uncharacterized protein n=1 Tax=Pediculus humanus subsp. corporis TaxID=121224 RepID=E0VM87_PEDHC|nr:uncharacterized protein Phum_PHUM304330 [Pediculus humanus corporis]EEB14493.1 hypothetical protein Phum_PHUM304330 [Pediculus humanus corporis]
MNLTNEIKALPKTKPPLLRSRTLPSIVVPGLNILQAQIDVKYRTGGTQSLNECFLKEFKHVGWLLFV